MTRTSSVFLRHAPCPSCHSKDNLGIYNDHEWCFGCGYHKSYAPSLRTIRAEVPRRDDTFADFRFTRSLPKRSVAWLRKYAITDEEADRYGLLWEVDKQWLGFPFYEDGKLVCANFRNFGEEGRKYYTFGRRTHMHIWGDPESGTLVMTEDCLSAIKVGRLAATYPVLGAHIDATALIRASKRFDRIVVWLDADKAKEASKAVQRASLYLPGRVFRAFSEKDPKEYDERELHAYLSELSPDAGRGALHVPAGADAVPALLR